MRVKTENRRLAVDRLVQIRYKLLHAFFPLEEHKPPRTGF